MKLSHIRDLVAVAEFGGLRRASRHLGVAQPALSRSIRDLEVELGTTLFERGSTGMTLTPAGQAFAQRGAAVQAELERARDEARQLQGDGAGQVAVGLSTAAHIALLPSALPPFLRRFPDAQLKISEGLFPTLEAQVRDGTIDFYVGPLAEINVGGALTIEKLCENNHVVLGRRGHPLAHATALGALVEAKWVATLFTLNSSTELNSVFKRHDLPAPTISVQTQTALSMVVVAATTDLLAVLPRQWLGSSQVALLTHIKVDTVLTAPPICIVSRARLPLTPMAQHLFDLFRRAGFNQ